MTSANQSIVYSIGHSDHTPEVFLELLRQHGITTVVDVRSQPYSRWVPAFNRETLAQTLAGAGVTYVFMGDSLGGRPADPALYDAGDPSGRPNYARLAATETFRAGIDQLIALAWRAPTAMMCSEGDYRQCHRALLLTPELLARGACVMHILPDGGTTEARPEAQQLTLF